jgi:hypothetical protein
MVLLEETERLTDEGLVMMMMRSTVVLPMILWACIFANPPAAPAEGAERDVPMFADPRVQRVYDCAANSLYVLCRKMGVATSYDRCMQLLPITSEGNSMLAVKQALIGLGLQVEAMRVSVDELADVSEPAIVWISFERQEPGANRLFGHYFVLWPISEGVVLVLDYPQEPMLLSVDLWIRYLHSTPTKDLVVLLCQRPGAPADRAVSSKAVVAESKRRACAAESEPREPPATVVLRAGASEPASAYLDFGSVAEGATLSHSFVVENQTGKTLHISKLQKSCSCSSLTSDKEMLQSGERCTVRMETSLAGRFSKQSFSGAIIFSPEDRMPPVRLLATGIVCGRIQVDPPVVDLGVCQPDSGRIVKKIRLAATGYATETSVSRVKSESPWITAKFDSVAGPGPGMGEITVIFDPELAIGVFQARVNVFLGQDKKPGASCMVKGEVRSDFLVRPSSLLVKCVAGENLAQVRIRHHGGKHLQVAGVKATQGEVQLAKVDNSTMDGEQAICLNIALLTREDGLCRGVILVDLAVEDEENTSTVRIPFVCMGPQAI